MKLAACYAALFQMPRAHGPKHLAWSLILTSILIPTGTTGTEFQPKLYGYRVVRVYPHDPNAFTQGLIYFNGHLYESTGLRGRSSLRMVDLQTGAVRRRFDLSSQLFGEGLTNWKDTLVQLTWMAQTGFVYDRQTFRLLKTFHYEGEGWGLTQDGVHLIMSDGSSSLRFLDTKTFQIVKRVTVSDRGAEVRNLNELEYVHGRVYANVWQTDRIAIISPENGRVDAWIDLTGLRPITTSGDTDAVLNGIAFDSEHDQLFITGKLWPDVFQIQLVQKHHPPAQFR
ncbi:MAG: glutaminyl-peptide cyclotransferase [Candidatus Acidiferrales bacterium]